MENENILISVAERSQYYSFEGISGKYLHFL
ncbi:hypothetical protein LCGC14_0774860 [marine sediment metagenome]|uniref:Uncharacterized protein n=1 Tax=marine sediment metagenome TaxID=412755 RepID=A0A0F9QH56_9ZZZZ